MQFLNFMAKPLFLVVVPWPSGSFSLLILFPEANRNFFSSCWKFPHIFGHLNKYVIKQLKSSKDSYTKSSSFLLRDAFRVHTTCWPPRTIWSPSARFWKLKDKPEKKLMSLLFMIIFNSLTDYKKVHILAKYNSMKIRSGSINRENLF